MSISNPNDYRGGSSNNVDDLSSGNPNKGSRHHGHGQSSNNGPVPTDVGRLSHGELVQRVRKLEADLIKLASDHNHMIREANHRIQV